MDSTTLTAARLSDELSQPVDAMASIEALGEAAGFVSICTPNTRYLEHARTLLGHGCHVLVEKPLFWMEDLTRARIADLCVSIFDEAAGRLAVNYPSARFAETFISACGKPKNVTDFWFHYQTRGRYRGDDIAVDLLPHPFSLLLKLRPVAPLTSLVRQAHDNEWRAAFWVGNTGCRIEFLQDPTAKGSSLSIAVNGQRANRIQVADGAGFHVSLELPGIAAEPFAMSNPMSSSIRTALDTCLDGAAFSGEPERTRDIMRLLADTLLE